MGAKPTMAALRLRATCVHARVSAIAASSSLPASAGALTCAFAGGHACLGRPAEPCFTCTGRTLTMKRDCARIHKHGYAHYCKAHHGGFT